ncbi:MFS transporter [Aquipuribacter hungaricus]|uniref:MFS transporter n=1 Tax=Aquipuribacter hungaricus TaxID=545624 RepID=A0ABV7WDA0_9MICO
MPDVSARDRPAADSPDRDSHDDGRPGGGSPGDGSDGSPDPRRWRALAVTLLAGFIVLLDVTIVAVALPSLQRDLDASASQVQWVVSGYTLTSALMLVTGGRMGDAWGRKRMFVVSLAAFVACSALAGLAPSVEWLVAARLLQGVAGGALTPQSSGLIQQMFSRAERGRAFGMFGATVGLATALGPVVGGGILAVASGEDGWRWIFYVNVPVGVLALVLAMRLLPRDTQRGGLRLDVVGTLLLGLATFAALLPLVTAEDGGLHRLWWLFAVAAVLGVAFVRWEHRVVARGGAPLLDPRLVSSTPGYAAGVALISVYFVGFSGVFLVLALFFQTGLDYTPLASGLAVTPFSIGAAVSAVVAGRLVGRFGRTLTVLGLAGVATGFGATGLLLMLAPASQAGWWAAPALLLAGLGGGFVISPNTTMTLSSVPVEAGGVASGTLQTGQRVGGAIGTALLPGVFYLVLAEDNAPHAVAVALGGATAVVLVALVVAVLDRRAGRRRDEATRTEDEEPVAAGRG